MLYFGCYAFLLVPSFSPSCVGFMLSVLFCFLSFECIGGSVSVQFAGLAFTLQLSHCLGVDKSNSTYDASSVAFETKV